MNFQATIALLFVLTLDFAPSTLAAVSSAPASQTVQTELARNAKKSAKICQDASGNYYECP